MSSICPRCSKVVYLAEQTMGPGRKLYHKPCLACMSCNKRLDSFTLLEHDQEPYCKSCHLKLFGTRDLRHANLPVASPPSSSPPDSPSNSPLRSHTTGSLAANTHFNAATNFNATTSVASNTGTISSTPPRPSFWSTRTSSVTPGHSSPTHFHDKGRIPEWDDSEDQSNANAHSPSANGNVTDEEMEVHNSLIAPDRSNIPEAEEGTSDHEIPRSTATRNTPTLTRTTRLNLNTATGRSTSPYKHHTNNSVGSALTPLRASSPLREHATGGSGYGSPSRAFSSGSFSGATVDHNSPNKAESPQALRSMPTGTRYGAALGGNGMTSSPVKTHSTGSSRKWGGETPLCERCGKSVYFAEQVKAVNKTFHKSCLRCTECGTSLDSRNLRDHEGVLFCGRCYGKNYGPQGGGYALLGKAGGG